MIDSTDTDWPVESEWDRLRAADEDSQRIFLCPEHRFVIVVRGDTGCTRGTPGHRATGCATCDQAVADAFAALAASEGDVDNTPALAADSRDGE